MTVVLIAAASTALAGCSTSGSSSAGASSGSSSMPNVTLQVADYQASSDPWTLWAQALAKEVAQQTDNHVKLTVYPNGELGTNTGTLTAVSQGAISMTDSAPQLEDSLIPGMGLEFQPGLVHTLAQANALDNSAQVMAVKNKELATKNLRLLSSCYQGVLTFMSQSPLSTVTTYKGVKIRVPDAANAAMVKAIGGDPVTVTLAETYAALQLGTVTATATNISNGYSEKFYQIAKYIDMTQLAGNFEDLLISTSAWNKLSPAEQKILSTDAQDSSATCTASYQSQTTSDLAVMKGAGAIVVNAPADYSQFNTDFAPLLTKAETENSFAVQLTDAAKAAMGSS